MNTQIKFSRPLLALLMVAVLAFGVSCGASESNMQAEADPTATIAPQAEADPADETQAEETHQDEQDEEEDHADEEHQDDDHADEFESLPELSAVSLGQGERLQVLATTNIVADVVAQVGGEQIALDVMLPPGTDPHTFSPAPRDLALLSEADVLFVNGLGLEEFLSDLIENAGEDVPVVPVSAGIAVREMADDHDDEHHEDEEHQDEDHADEHHEDEESHDEHEDDHEDEHDDDHADDHEDEHQDDDHAHDGEDPHTWTSPANVMVFVENVAASLAELDPANADVYAANAAQYVAELEELDAWVQTQIETIPPENRRLVTDHRTFGYYADRYGLEEIGAVVASFSTNAEPSARELAALQDLIAEYGVPAIFVGNTVNPTLADQISADTGAEILRLYTGSLDAPGGEVDSYLDYIRYNTETIVAGLQ